MAAAFAAGGFVLRVDGGHPDDFRAGAAGDFDGDGIETADRVIERNSAVSGDAGDGLGDDLGAFGGGDVVGFQDEAFQAVGEKLFCEIDVVDAAFDYVGRDVDLEVVGALEGLPGAVGGGVGGAADIICFSPQGLKPPDKRSAKWRG